MFKDIHVHVDNGDVCIKRLHAAAELTQRLNAHLTGIYVKRPFTMPLYAEVPIGDQLIEQYAQLIEQKQKSARAGFEGACEKYDISTSWRTVEGRLDLCLAEEARYSDLLILGQADPKDELERNRGLADQLLLTSGRPCLIIPHIGVEQSLGERIVIAWNGEREASRAIHDALPLLEQSSQVIVLMANPEESNVDFEDMPGSMISHHLARHNIKVELDIIDVDQAGLCDAILSYVTENNIDLLVMGAYGHSRLREVVMGGMTREILARMSIPLFMSH